MKKGLFTFLVALFLLPSLFSLNLEIEKLSHNEAMIVGVDEPATFDIKVTNLGAETSVEIYNLVGLRMVPSKLDLGSLETKTISLEVSPIGDFNYLGPYSFKYFFRDSTGEAEQSLSFNRVELRDSIEIGASSFNPESNTITVYVKNLENFNFKDMKAEFSSAFFSVDKTFDLPSREMRNFSIDLKKEDLSRMLAGFYTMNTEITADQASEEYETSLEFEEKNLLKTEEENYGFIVHTEIIKKANEGNIVIDGQTVVKKNIISRLFTTFSPAPDTVQREGATVTYVWNKELNPGDSYEVTVKTNWTFPLILVILVIIVVIIAKKVTKTDVSLTKKVSFLRAKGGEFAIKVSVYAKANTYVENVHILDRLPMLVKLYGQFGNEKPSKVNEKGKVIEWNFDRLEAGERRLMTYVLYSKVGVLGKFALPATRAVFEKDGKIKESESNRAFFLSEQKGEPQVDY